MCGTYRAHAWSEQVLCMAVLGIKIRVGFIRKLVSRSGNSLPGARAEGTLEFRHWVNRLSRPNGNTAARRNATKHFKPFSLH